MIITEDIIELIFYMYVIDIDHFSLFFWFFDKT